MEKNYVAPELEVLEVMVETGFAGSTTPNGATDGSVGGINTPSGF